jgi:hypothetical protein
MRNANDDIMETLEERGLSMITVTPNSQGREMIGLLWPVDLPRRRLS